VLLAAFGALGGEWDIEPRIEVEEAFTDNVNLTRDNKQVDFITVLRPGVSFSATGTRLEVDVDYEFERALFLDNNEKDNERQRLASRGSTALIDGRLFVDAKATITQQSVSSRAATSSTTLTDTQNQTTTTATSISPFFRHHFGSWADAELRYTLDDTSFDAQGPSDTTTNRFTGNVTSGRRFSKLIWSLIGDTETTERTPGGRTTEHHLAIADLQYVISSQIAVLASGGFESIRDSTLATEPDGPIGSVGVLLAPTPDAALRVTFGRRFEKFVTGFDASYQIGPRTEFTASFVESVKSSLGQLREDLSFLGRDPTTRGLVDTRTLRPLAPRDPSFDLDDTAFGSRRFDAAISRNVNRDQMNLKAFYEIRDQGGGGSDDKILGASFQWNRRLTHRAEANLDLSYRHSEFGGDDELIDDRINISADLNYQVSRDISGSIQYDRIMRLSSDGDRNFTENVIAVLVRGVF
jgi:uncharacterized protein (PEP-CTERM system associated)